MFVEDCIDRVVHNPKRSYLEEGTTQASVSRFGDGNPLVVDREAVVGFRDQPTKDRLLADSRRPLAKVLAAASKEPQYTWLRTGLTASECDLLAINDGHELLTIEIKPASAKSWVTHAPLQAWQYARQFQMWAQHYEDEGQNPRDIIAGMYAQRGHLGLETSARPFALDRPLVVRPAVAVRPGYSARTRQRFAALVQLLRDTGLDEPAMLFSKVNLVGRLDPFDPLDPESWA